MVKQYAYRKYIKIMRNIFPTVFGIMAALILIGSIVAGVILGEGNVFYVLVMIIMGIILSLMLLVPVLFVWFFFGRFTKILVTLTDDEIIYKNIKGETRIPIADIQRIETPSINYAGGWITIISSKDTIRLTVALENIGDFVKNLKNFLDKKGAQNTYNRQTMFSFYKTAVYADQSWERLYEIFLKMCGGGIGLSALSIFISILLGKPAVIIWLLTGALFLPIVIYFIGELVFVSKVSKQANEEHFEIKPRDKAYEKRVYSLCVIIGLVIYLSLSIVLWIL